MRSVARERREMDSYAYDNTVDIWFINIVWIEIGGATLFKNKKDIVHY